MKRLFRVSLVLVFMLFIVAVVRGEDIFRPTSYEALTIDDTAGGVPLTVAKYFTAATSKIVADYAVFAVETAQVRFTVDGTAPTTTVGVLLNPGQMWILSTFEELKNFRMIRVGGSAALKVMYFKRYRQ